MLSSYLVLKLLGPFQSWGVDSQFNYRKTGMMPTKSAIAGMCCAALGYSRGCKQEKDFLELFQHIKMLAIAIPREHNNKIFEVNRLRDYHTVAKTRTAQNKIKKTSQLTYRFYLQDSQFGVLLEGNPNLLKHISEALMNPIWGMFLGRKNCIPTSPLHMNNDKIKMFYDTKDDALKFLLNGKPLGTYTHQFGVDSFEKGDDSLLDNAISFGSIERDKLYAPRRVKNVVGLIDG